MCPLSYHALPHHLLIYSIPDQRLSATSSEPHPSTLCRTCDALAAEEVHALHALGEHDLVDSTCRWEGEEAEKETMRNKETSAAGRQNVLNKYEPRSSFTQPYL